MIENKAAFLEKALKFALDAHHGIARKYTDIPYILHPIAVMNIVMEVIPDDVEVHAACLLHDTIEDTDVTANDIRQAFTERVALLVVELTDVSIQDEHKDKHRNERKALDRDHLSRSSYEGATIKLADLLHNTDSIVQHDPGFARRKYMPEKAALLEVLQHGHPALLERARVRVDEYFLANPNVHRDIK